MKGGFEVVNRALNMIQPHELWDGGPPAWLGPSPKVVESRSLAAVNMEGNDVPDWVEHVSKQLIEDFPGENAGGGESSIHNHSESSMASGEDCAVVGATVSEGQEFRPRKMLKRSDHLDDGMTNSDNLIQTSSSDDGKSCPEDQEEGLGLLTLLLECAVSISVDNLGEAHRLLIEVTQMASPYGPSCAERVVAYFAKAMSSRVINSWLGISAPLVDYKSINSAFQVFNNVLPFVKFAHFTSNQAILEAFSHQERVHIIDLDIMQGLQWPALFHILATRAEGPPHVRMTGMGASIELLIETGRQLSNFAKRLGMSFEFHPVARKFGEIDPSMIQIRQGETLAVHWLQHSLYDATGLDWKTLRILDELCPRVFTLVEQDIAQGGSFLDRFVGSLHYYSTVFDSLGAYIPHDDPNRHRVEHSLLHKEINNILAVGGPARSGEEKFRSWRGELARSGGFVQVTMSASSMAQAQLILNMFPQAHGYNLSQGDGTLKLGWKDTSLYTASAWTSSHQCLRR
ncbi:hypothetical protein MLD38_026454 [Melastoma candidum]|uniref:Uncharacterized protein n=1 Tax=Melastoma candidum TaxID=119954 RepID=A0ACB9NYM7_9MYRT|nr:hypothetical protein MLD38_026454 [Melastoma candidum]